MGHVLNVVAQSHERYVLTRHGKPVAALISIDDCALLEAFEDRADIVAVKVALTEGGEAIDWDEVKSSLGL